MKVSLPCSRALCQVVVMWSSKSITDLFVLNRIVSGIGKTVPNFMQAVRIRLIRPYTYATIYLSPHNLDDLKDQYGSCLFHFYSWTILMAGITFGVTLWGPWGRSLTSLFSRVDALLLKRDTSTHFQIQTRSFSNIDRSIGSPGAQSDFTWHVTEATTFQHFWRRWMAFQTMG